MEFKSPLRLLALFIIALFFSLLPLCLLQAPRMTFTHHFFRLELVSWVFLAALLFLGFSGYYLLLGRFYTTIYAISPAQAATAELLSFSIFLLAPLGLLSLRHYLTAFDLYGRLKLFLIFLLGGSIWIKVAFLHQLEKQKPYFTRSISQMWSNFTPKKKIAVLFLGAFLIYNLGSLTFISQGLVFSGDEPHYLLMSHSLLLDGDLNLKNNYNQHDYRLYMRPYVTIDPHLAPKTQGKYSFHSPGISFLILPFYALGYFGGGFFLPFLTRLGMTIWAAFLGIQLFLFLIKLKFQEKTALLAWTLFSFTSPLFFYSFHLYPEIPAAAISFYVFRKIYFLGRHSLKFFFFLGLLTASLIWFHSLKYLFIMAPLFLYASWKIIRNSQSLQPWLTFCLGWTTMLSGYFLFQQQLYNSLSLSAVSWRGAVSINESLKYALFLIKGIPFPYRWETLLGYFLDQRDGLLLYSPIFIFALLGFIGLIKNNFRFLLLLLFVSAPYYLVSAWLTQRTGYAPQARPLVAVLWSFGLGLAFYLHRPAPKIISSIFKVCVFLSFLFPLLQLKFPHSLYQLTTQGETQRSGELFLHLSNMHFDLTRFLPSFLKIDNHLWWPNWLWLGIIIIIITAYSLLPAKEMAPKSFKLRPRLIIFPFVVVIGLFFWFGYYPRTTLGPGKTVSFPNGKRLLFFAYSRAARQERPGHFKLLESNRDYVFYFSSVKPLDYLLIEVGSPEGNFYFKIDYFDETIFQQKVKSSFQKVALPLPPSYKYRNRLHLYRIKATVFFQGQGNPPPCWLRLLPWVRTS